MVRPGPSVREYGGVAQNQTLADPPGRRNAQRFVRGSHGTFRIRALRNGPVRYLLRNISRFQTIRVQLVVAIFVENFDDYPGSALYNETGKAIICRVQTYTPDWFTCV